MFLPQATNTMAFIKGSGVGVLRRIHGLPPADHFPSQVHERPGPQQLLLHSNDGMPEAAPGLPSGEAVIAVSTEGHSCKHRAKREEATRARKTGDRGDTITGKLPKASPRRRERGGSLQRPRSEVALLLRTGLPRSRMPCFANAVVAIPGAWPRRTCQSSSPSPSGAQQREQGPRRSLLDRAGQQQFRPCDAPSNDLARLNAVPQRSRHSSRLPPGRAKVAEVQMPDAIAARQPKAPVAFQPPHPGSVRLFKPFHQSAWQFPSWTMLPFNQGRPLENRSVRTQGVTAAEKEQHRGAMPTAFTSSFRIKLSTLARTSGSSRSWSGERSQSSTPRSIRAEGEPLQCPPCQRRGPRPRQQTNPPRCRGA